MHRIRLVLSILILSVFTCSPASGRADYHLQGTGIIPAVIPSEGGNYYGILGIFRGSPASKTKLRVGDRLVSINGKKTGMWMGGTEGIFKALNPPAGNTVKFIAARPPRLIGERGEYFNVALTSDEIRIISTTVPRMRMPEAQIIDTDGMNFCGTTFKPDDPVWYGDHFFVFDGIDCVGTATIQKNETTRARFDDPPGSKNLEALKDMKLVFFRPRRQLVSNKNDVRNWLVRLPVQKIHPLYKKYDRNKSYERLAGEVMSHDAQKMRIALKVVTDIKTLWGSSFISGGERNYLVRTQYERVEVYYNSGTDEIPKNAKKDLKTKDYVGIFYKKSDNNIINADLVHILNLD
jgi:hypothetical protein